MHAAEDDRLRNSRQNGGPGRTSLAAGAAKNGNCNHVAAAACHGVLSLSELVTNNCVVEFLDTLII